MFAYFEKFYYLNLLVIVSCLFAVGFGFANYKKLGHLRAIVLYALASVIQSLLVVGIILFGSDQLFRSSFIEVSANIFLILESLLFSYFLIKVLKSKLFKNGILITLTLFYAGILVYWATTQSIYVSPDYLTVIEAIFILFTCLFYYYELFVYPPTRDLLRDPSFWIVTGMFILFSMIIPLFLFRNNILLIFKSLYERIYSITFIAYIILFGCFIKAIKCQTQIAKS